MCAHGRRDGAALMDVAVSLPLCPWLSSTPTYDELRKTEPRVDSCSSPVISAAEWLLCCIPRHMLSSFVCKIHHF